jgi:hypothetical protein
MLVNKQVYVEARDIFLSTTAFEVQPLTTSNANKRSLDGYEALLMSKYALEIRKLRVRIDVARFSVDIPSYTWSRLKFMTYGELGLEECLQRLALLAEDLCRVLRTSVPSSRVVEIGWVDVFVEAVDGTSLQRRTNVLVLFTALAGAYVRLRKLFIPERGRREVMAMMKQILR